MLVGASSIYGGQNAMAQMMGREVGRKTTLREGLDTGTNVPKLEPYYGKR